MKLSVIILTYNSENWIIKNLSSVIKECNRSCEIIVVDNSSKDKTLKEVRALPQKIKIIENKRNFGFSRGVNIGIRHSLGASVLLLNPDLVVCGGAIRQLLNDSIKYSADIAGGKLYKTNHNKQVHGSYVRDPNMLTAIFDYTNFRKLILNDKFHKLHYYYDLGVIKNPTYVNAVSGAFMLINKRVFNKIGYFDENFFMYLEDVDFCIRARKAGYKVIYSPQASAMHEGGASSTNKDKIHYEAWSNSRKYFFKKNFSFTRNLILQPLFLLDDFITKIWRLL